MAPCISVILPVWNGQDYVQECIRSVLRQSLPEFELLIGDDGSTDASPHLVMPFNDSRIRYFRSEGNAGLFKNLNRLLAQARSPLVHFLCQDDVLEPDCLETEVAFFKNHPEVGVSFCKALVIDSEGTVVERGALGDLPTVMSPSLNIQHFFYHGCIPGNLSTVCAKLEVLKEVGLFDESFRVSGDYELWVRIVQKYPLGVIHRHLVRLRSHSKQLSKAPASGIDFIRENRKIRAMLRPLLPYGSAPWADLYRILRHNVLDTHYAVRCLARGRFRDFLQVASIMGPTEFALGLISWLLTLNNHLWRPKPKFFEA